MKTANDYLKEYNKITDQLLRIENQLNSRLKDLKRLNSDIIIDDEIYKNTIAGDNIKFKIDLILYFETELEKRNVFKQLKMFED